MNVKVHPAGTVIFPKRGGAIATNKKRVLAQPSAFDLNTMGLVAGDEIHPTFLWLWLESIDLSRLSDGSNVPQINYGDMSHLLIPLPPLGDQHLIVAEVERQFSIIDAMDRTIAAGLLRADALRQSILSRAFSGHLDMAV